MVLSWRLEARREAGFISVASPVMHLMYTSWIMDQIDFLFRLSASMFTFFLWKKVFGNVNVNNRFRLDSNLKQLFKIPFHSKVDFNKVFLTEYKKSSDLNLI